MIESLHLRCKQLGDAEHGDYVLEASDSRHFIPETPRLYSDKEEEIEEEEGTGSSSKYGESGKSAFSLQQQERRKRERVSIDSSNTEDSSEQPSKRKHFAGFSIGEPISTEESSPAESESEKDLVLQPGNLQQECVE